MRSFVREPPFAYLPTPAYKSTTPNRVRPLPALRPKSPAPKAKALPLTGTYQCSLDEKGQLTLPRAIRDQLNSSDTVLLSPGPDKCLWLTNQPHLERLGERLDQSQANEADVRVFKRLYFAQTEKLSVNGDGRVTIPERLGQFAGLRQEIVLVGIDDHFEVWDAGAGVPTRSRKAPPTPPRWQIRNEVRGGFKTSLKRKRGLMMPSLTLRAGMQIASRQSEQMEDAHETGTQDRYFDHLYVSVPDRGRDRTQNAGANAFRIAELGDC